jgi:hypothetical protein
MKTTVSLLAFTLGIFAHSTPLSAAVVLVTDPTIFTGANAINTAGRTLVSASGATSETTLEAISGFFGIHDFAFSGNQSTSEEYVFDFTSINAVDVRIRYSGSVATGSTVQVANAAFSTSTSSSFRYAANGNMATVGLRIDFGTYDTDLGVFATDKGVQAMALTLPTGSATNPVTIGISYYDAANNLLSSQFFTSSQAGTTFGYSGYQSTGAPIAYALLSYTNNGSVPVVTMDDLSFAPVPEPHAVLLLASASSVFLLRRRYRASGIRLS